MPFPGYTLSKQTLFFREKKHTHSPSNHRPTGACFLKGKGTRTPCPDSGGTAFPPWPHHPCPFKELWLQSVWRGNPCFSSCSLPHLNVSLGNSLSLCKPGKERAQRSISTSSVLPSQPPTSLLPADQLEQQDAHSPICSFP